MSDGYAMTDKEIVCTLGPIITAVQASRSTCMITSHSVGHRIVSIPAAMAPADCQGKGPKRRLNIGANLISALTVRAMGRIRTINIFRGIQREHLPD